MPIFADRLALLGSGRKLGPPGREIRPTFRIAFAARVTTPRSRSAFKLKPGLSGQLEQLVESAGPAIERAGRRFFLPLVERAVARWPVATGLSRARFAVQVRQTTTGVQLSMVNTVPYADWIGGDGDVARELIFETGERAADRMAQAIAEDIGR